MINKLYGRCIKHLYKLCYRSIKIILFVYMLMIIGISDFKKY